MGFPDHQKGEVSKQSGGGRDNAEERVREDTSGDAFRVISTTESHQDGSKKRETQDGIFDIFVIFRIVGVDTGLGEGEVGNEILKHTDGAGPSTKETTDSGAGEH